MTVSVLKTYLVPPVKPSYFTYYMTWIPIGDLCPSALPMKYTHGWKVYKVKHWMWQERKIILTYVTMILTILAHSPRRSTGDKSGRCNWILCLSVYLFWANFLIFIQYSTVEYSTVQYKAAGPVRAVISIRYGSKEGVQGSLLVPQYIRP